MTIVEGTIVALIVALALAIVVIKMVKPFGKAKGTCRACGTTCSCEKAHK